MKPEYNVINNNQSKLKFQNYTTFKASKKKELYKRIENRYSNAINLILFNLIFLSLLKENDSGYISLKIHEAGYNQILSNNYDGEFPKTVKINGHVKSLNGRGLVVPSVNDEITLEWDHCLSDFTYMFSNLDSITSITLDNIFAGTSNITLYYMFKNCVNLIDFNFYQSYSPFHYIRRIEGMFYGCTSLLSFSFNDFYLDGYNYYINDIRNYRDNQLTMSYMFYNCHSLNSIYFNVNRKYCNISNAESMFYNCTSLHSLDLQKFGIDNNINLNYMFYNCTSLETIIMPYSYDDFGIKYMKQMFYNCYSLKRIAINNNPSYYYYYYLDMSQLFYNCSSLETVNINFKYLYITNTKEMFYNCSSLRNIFFNPYYLPYSNIDMSKMFYNCRSIRSIVFDIDYNSDNDNKNYYYPNDMNYMFYNCDSLETLTFKYFNTKYVIGMKEMLYNCISLYNFDITSSSFTNDKITDMKGLFKNLVSLRNLNLTNFYTPKVQIMWEMFKGCTNLGNLQFPNFDTSQVTDMQSMFEGCSSFGAMTINGFITTNVQYMNKMFKDCTNLKSLYFQSLSTKSLGTMYQMFYNCHRLEYLNLYSLKETGQSLHQMFDGTFYRFKLCIYDEKNIPDIYKEILRYPYIQRDCSEDCYNDGKNRIYIHSKKLCCTKYAYNDECVDDCPIRTADEDGDHICTNLQCDYYFTYGQRSCSNVEEIPVGYFMNDTRLKTIDKCHPNCATCKEKPTNTSSKCLTCNSIQPFIFLGNCYSSCLYGEFNDTDGVIKCKCFNEKCFKCSEQSLKFDLCEKCNDGYYQIYNDKTNKKGFVNCYKEPEEYYLDEKDGEFIYLPCYKSCKYCLHDGDKYNHYCTSCNILNTNSIPMELNETFINNTNSKNNTSLMNCYPKCVYNFIFDENDDYVCLDEPGCPEKAKLFVVDSKQCVDSCKKVKNKFQFQEKCFFECPPESKPVINGTGSFCVADCPIEKPFEMVETQTCVERCKIMDRYNKLCITNYHGNRSYEIHDMVMSSILDDIIDTFNYHFITQNKSLILDEKPFVYEITSTNCSYVNPNLGRVRLKDCEKKLKDYFGIPYSEPLYILKVDADIEGKIGPKVEYEVYYPFNGFSLHQLDISICEGIDISIDVPINTTIDNIDKFDRYSAYYNDICYTYTNENGTDVTLEDRQEEFIKYNRSVCDEDCRLVSVDSTGDRAECSCEIMFNIPFVSQITIDKNKLYKFINIKNIANFKMLVCYKLFFSAKGIKINIGYYCLLFILVVYFICLFYFYIKEYKLIKLIINEIVYAKKNEKYLDKKYKFRKTKKSKQSVFKVYVKKKKLEHEFDIEEILKAEKENITKIKNENEKNLDLIDKEEENKDIDQTKNENINIKETKNEKVIKTDENSTNKLNIVNKINKINNPPPIRKQINANNNINISPSKTAISKNSMNKKKPPIHIINNKYYEKFNEKQKEKIKYILSYIDSELNNLTYKKALEYDKRSYFQYYISLLLTNHNFFKIFNKRDYNACSIKILLFFFDFASNYAVNALFFNDETMHQIYNDGGDFNFVYQLPQIIYSTVISIIIDSIISFLGLSQDDILSVKNVKKAKDVERRAKQVLRTLHIKFIFFFIITFFFLILYWYYLGCFCAVYINTQFHLIKDTLIGYGTSTVTPLGKSLAPGIFRIPTLRKFSKGKKLIYMLSQLLQKI